MSGAVVYRTVRGERAGTMTPLARKLVDLGQAVDLSDQELIEAIRWFAVRGIGFTVRTTYDMKGDGEIAGYDIKRD